MDVFFPATGDAAISSESNDIDAVLSKRNDFAPSSSPLKNNEVLKDGITTVVGAVLDKQQCWEKAACLLGRETRQIAARDLIFL